MRQNFMAGILLLLMPFLAQAESTIAGPQSFADLRWQNRVLVACDLARPAYATDLSAALNAIMLSDRANHRRLRVGLIGSDGWTLYAPDPLRSDRAALQIGSGCRLENCREIFPPQEGRHMAERMGCETDHVKIALIGLDGGLKQLWQEVVPSAAEVFALIDAMPMRAAEIARQAKDD